MSVSNAMSVTLHLPGEHISDASLRLDDLRGARIILQFAAKAKNLHVDAPIENVFVDSGRLQKMLSAKRALRRVEERDQQRVFALGQCNVRAIRIGKPSGAQIELPAGKAIAPTFRLASRRGARSVEPTNDRSHPGQKLAQVEGLGQVVVGAELETYDPVDLIPAVAGDDDHRHVRARSDLPQHVEPILESEPKVQDHNVDFLRAKLSEHLSATGRQQRPDVVVDEVV